MDKLKILAARKLQWRLALFACLLAFCVVIMGAFVRLSDAGLGVLGSVLALIRQLRTSARLDPYEVHWTVLTPR